jgi:hypothetical protein
LRTLVFHLHPATALAFSRRGQCRSVGQKALLPPFPPLGKAEAWATLNRYETRESPACAYTPEDGTGDSRPKSESELPFFITFKCPLQATAFRPDLDGCLLDHDLFVSQLLVVVVRAHQAAFNMAMLPSESLFVLCVLSAAIIFWSLRKGPKRPPGPPGEGVLIENTRQVRLHTHGAAIRSR